jgi:ABC-type lipoprotein release transport system permease subunit
MTLGRLLLRNLFYHWRGNLAVLLGVVVGATVLTGALLVGDSLRGSLRALAERRLGWVEYALIPGRFVREELAVKLRAKRVSPAILLQGSVVKGDFDSPEPRVPKVVLYGVDKRFWPDDQLPQDGEFWQPAGPPQRSGVVLGSALARDLNVAAGDKVTFYLQTVSGVPRETVLGRRKAGDVVSFLSFDVAAVLPDHHFGSQFSLSPTAATPRNAFVPLRLLQWKLPRQEEETRSRENQTLPRQPVNAFFVHSSDRDALQSSLRQYVRLEDWGLFLGPRRVRKWPNPLPEYYSLESKQIFLGPATQRAAEEAGLKAAPTLVYLVNTIASGKRQSPYAIVAALDPALPPPLGPFLTSGMKELADNEILLARWEGSPLADVKPGDDVTLTYFEPREEGSLREETVTLKLAGTVPVAGVTGEPYLTPQFPGITDSETLSAWDPPFPFDRKRIRTNDDNERFWKAHHTTPKAYVNLKTGIRLWGSRFGPFTSIRIAPDGLSKEEVAKRILARLRPEDGGLVFQDVRGRGLEASTGGTDFGMLFLGFSAFLIAAALLLVGLLFRLNLDRRVSEVGLLLAAGFRRGTVRLLFLLEGSVLALVGAALGCAGALLYAWVMLAFLRASWPGGLDRSFLGLHAEPVSYAVGFASSVLVSLLTIFWATRLLARVAPSSLLAGTTLSTLPETPEQRRPRWGRWVAGVAIVLATACLGYGWIATDPEAKAGSFFGSGFLLLVALLALVWARLRGRQLRPAATPSLTGLGVRNAARHPLRSVLTVGLLGASTFLVVAVQAFHRDPGRDFLDRDGGSGGFPLLAEAEVPVFQDLNTSRGREDLNVPTDALRHTRVFPLRISPGDDASCLNLYKPLQPRLLGVPPSLIDRGGFRFEAAEATTPEEKANPWLLLRKSWRGGAVPVFGEANSVTWILKSGLGQELDIKNDRGETVRLRVVGLLQDSIFQSELLTSEANFLRIYPRQEGFQMFLLDTPADETAQVKAALEKGLADNGLYVTPTAERLASFLAVENTYLATFQALGGLGLLLGALGLAVVLLRAAWERRGELALLRAVGFRRSSLGWLVLAENACLLLVGLTVGTVAALVAVAPHLLSGAGEVPWLRLLALLGLVLAVGLAAGAAAVFTTVRAPVLTALRRE